MLVNQPLNIFEDNRKILDIARALSSPQRLDILRLLSTDSLSIKEIADRLDYPLSSTSLNVTILEDCGLLSTQETINSAGKSKLCSRNVDQINMILYHSKNNSVSSTEILIPIGSYTDYSIEPGCGIATPQKTLDIDNDETVFFHPERYRAGLIWFSKGFLEYRVNNKMLPRKLKKLSLSFEACSEAPFYRNDWKSDIAVWINDVEIGTWRSMGDFGGRPGIQNPKWWPKELTQFGSLTTFDVDESGTSINGVKASDINLDHLDLFSKKFITLRIGVKDDAYYCGGVNLFGSSFGDYKQDIRLEVHW
ncbi:MAG: helix-turn-helix domain-containing protein [Bacilli bacterium]|jgi:predicted transcriptional regulator